MKISILLPVYNMEKYLAQTLTAIAEQTFREFELIAIDDCSTDNSPEILRQFASKFPSLKIIRNSTNQHAAGTMNIGLKACQSDYVFRNDADDWLRPDALEKMIKTLEKDTSLNAVVCDALRVDAQGQPKRLLLTLTEDYFLKKCELFRMAFGGQPCLIRRDVWFAAGLHAEHLRAGSDRDIGIKMIRHIRIAGIPERLYIYREHADNITSNSKGYKNSPEYLEHFRRLTESVFRPEDYINDWAQVRRHKTLEFDYAPERQRKYANTILRCALHLALLGRRPEALEELKKAQFLAPRINYQAFALLLRLGVRDLRNFWVNMNCWFKYAYDDLNIVDLK